MTENLSVNKSLQTRLMPGQTQDAENKTCFQEPDKNRELKKLFGRLWEAADELRANSKLRSAQYSTPVLGILFACMHESQRELEAKLKIESLKLFKKKYPYRASIYG